MEKQLIILGGGGHAKVLLSALRASHRPVLGFTDLDASKTTLLGLARLGTDDAVASHPPDRVELVNGLGSVKTTELRRRIFDRFRALGYTFAQVIHPAANIAAEVDLGEGVQIMAGAVIQPGCRLAENCVVNTLASVDHDCQLDAHVHVAPGAVLSGEVHVGAGSHIGTGARIIQSVTIGKGCVVGAGATVLKNVAPGQTVVGLPARPLVRPNVASNGSGQG